MKADPAHNLPLTEMDKQSHLHPITSIADHLTQGPQILRSGAGVTIQDIDGRSYIDGMAGLWCVNVGYAIIFSWKFR